MVKRLPAVLILFFAATNYGMRMSPGRPKVDVSQSEPKVDALTPNAIIAQAFFQQHIERAKKESIHFSQEETKKINDTSLKLAQRVPWRIRQVIAQQYLGQYEKIGIASFKRQLLLQSESKTTRILASLACNYAQPRYARLIAAVNNEYLVNRLLRFGAIQHPFSVISRDGTTIKRHYFLDGERDVSYNLWKGRKNYMEVFAVYKRGSNRWSSKQYIFAQEYCSGGSINTTTGQCYRQLDFELGSTAVNGLAEPKIRADDK